MFRLSRTQAEYMEHSFSIKERFEGIVKIDKHEIP